MKHIILWVAGLFCVALIGCNGTGTPGGNTSAKDKDSKPMVGTADETFSLDVPNLSTSIKQGEAKQLSIAIKRGKNFSKDVALSFECPAKGVTFEPANPAIKGSDTEAKFTVKADDKADVGDFTVKVKGKPTDGAEAGNEFKISVKPK